MTTNRTTQIQIAILTVALSTGLAIAHCDTTSGPVIQEAKTALEKGDVTPLLKWITKENEPEVKTAFAKAVAVRAKGPEAKELADQYFLETLVRLHRAGEGFPFTGIKDEPPEKIVQLSDKALAAGSPDELVKKLQGYIGEAIKEKFNKVVETAKNKDKSVESGRAYVAAYIEYMHFIEGIHTAAMSAGHHGETAATSNPHTTHAGPDAAHHED
jgi:hypothetical protein